MKVVYYATQRVARANSCVRASCILSRCWLSQRRSWEVATNHKAQIKAKKIQSLCSTENCSKRVIFNKMSSVLIIFDAGSGRFLIRNLVCLSSEEKIRCAKLKKNSQSGVSSNQDVGVWKKQMFIDVIHIPEYNYSCPEKHVDACAILINITSLSINHVFWHPG